MPFGGGGSGLIRQMLLTATANTTITIPAGYGILALFIRNTTANAVTGGIKIGTTSGAIDVVVAQAVGASAYIGVTDAALLLKAFSPTVDQSLFVQAVTSWNSASLNLTFFIAPLA